MKGGLFFISVGCIATAYARSTQPLLTSTEVDSLLSEENLSTLLEIKKHKNGHHGIWYSAEKNNEFTAGCLTIPTSFHTPSLSIRFLKKDGLINKYVVVQYDDNKVVFDIGRKRRVSFFGKSYLIETRRMDGGSFMSDEWFSFEAFHNVGRKNYIYFPDKIKVFLIPKHGETKITTTNVTWRVKLKCTSPSGSASVDSD